MNIKTTILVWLLSLAPMVVLANPVTGTPLYQVFPILLIAVAAEAVVELLLLQWREAGATAFAGFGCFHR